MASRASDLGQKSAKVRRLIDTLSWADTRGLNPFKKGSRKHYAPTENHIKQTFFPKESINRIGISMFEEYGQRLIDRETFIAGIEFISKERDQPNKIFGYRIPGKQVYIDFESWKDVRGFEFVRSEGSYIHAIRICHVQKSHWVGSPKANNPVTERLISDREILGLQGQFDVSRVQLSYCYMDIADTFSLAL
jgi:hypothetical protein